MNNSEPAKEGEGIAVAGMTDIPEMTRVRAMGKVTAKMVLDKTAFSYPELTTAATHPPYWGTSQRAPEIVIQHRRTCQQAWSRRKDGRYGVRSS